MRRGGRLEADFIVRGRKRTLYVSFATPVTRREARSRCSGDPSVTASKAENAATVSQTPRGSPFVTREGPICHSCARGAVTATSA